MQIDWIGPFPEFAAHRAAKHCEALLGITVRVDRVWYGEAWLGVSDRFSIASDARFVEAVAEAMAEGTFVGLAA